MKKYLNEVIESFFNVEGEYSESDLEQFDKEHSFISIGILVLFVIILFGIMLLLAPYGFELDTF